MDRILWVGLGGFLGANCRYWLSLWLAERWGTGFPLGTLIVNVSGSFLLGFFVALASGRLPIDPNLRLLIAVGFCGGYTTFSTYSVEGVGLLGERAFGPATLYLAGSVVLGLAAVWLGLFLGRRLAG